MLWKDNLSKKIALEYDLSYTMRKDGISFSQKYDIFFTDGKWKMIFLKKYTEIWYFLYVDKVVYLFPTNMKLHFCQKSKDDLFPKNTLKDYISGIAETDDIHPRKDDIDWHSRKGCNDSIYFYGDLFKCFDILFSNEKNPGNLIYRLEIWLYL